MRPQNTHWLAENESERSPRRLIFWDTEGIPVGDGDTHALRCWCARSVLRKNINPRQPREDTTEGTSAQVLASWISSRARTDTPLWVCAHGASYDLTITRLPLLLIELGWELGQHALTSGEPWAHFRQGSKTIRLVDSHSFLPYSLDKIGDRLGIPKLPLPEWDADEQEWRDRCWRDVEITTRAMLQFLDWWDRDHLGSFADTGPGSGWHAMRHMPAADKVLIDSEAEGRAFDRQALYGGRRDVWRKGYLPLGWYVELDLVQAHLSICASQALPVRRVSEFESLEIDSRYLDDLSIGVIAEAEIRTEVPRYPLRLKDVITYPVGRFKTWLCSPELAYARELGELRSIGRGRRYRLGFAMENWAQWCQRILAGQDQTAPPVAEMACKGWSRSVPGRWAMRTGRQDFELASPERGWFVTWGRDHETRAPRTILTMGGREIWLVQDQEADSSFPAVLAWIQSHTRVMLDRLISRLPQDSVILCDTDGVLVKAAELIGEAIDSPILEWDPLEVRNLAELQLNELQHWTRPVRLQVKDIIHQAEVLGPQHSIRDGRRKLAGVRAGAEEIRPKVYSYQTWPRLAAQMAFGDPAGYRFGQAAVDLSRVRVNRWEYADGCCEPLRATLWPPDDLLLSWIPDPFCSGHSSPLCEAQHPSLRDLQTRSAPYIWSAFVARATGGIA